MNAIYVSIVDKCKKLQQKSILILYIKYLNVRLLTNESLLLFYINLINASYYVHPLESLSVQNSIGSPFIQGGNNNR